MQYSMLLYSCPFFFVFISDLINDVLMAQYILNVPIPYRGIFRAFVILFWKSYKFPTVGLISVCKCQNTKITISSK